MVFVDEALQKAVALFNDGQFAEFQDALDSMTSATRASSERQFYTLLKNLAEALLQLSDGDVEDAEGMRAGRAAQARRVPAPLPRPQRGRPAGGLRSACFAELRESRAGRRRRSPPRGCPGSASCPSDAPCGLVVFDLDGTLVDSARDLATAVNATLRPAAPPAARPGPGDASAPSSGTGPGSWWRAASRRPACPTRPEDVLPLFLEDYSRCLLETTRLYPGVAEALDALADRRLAVLTNKPGDMSRAILEGLGVAGRFFRIYGAGRRAAAAEARSGGPPPPDGGGAGRAGRRPSMVGDSAVDVRTGRAAGVLTAGVTTGSTAEGLAAPSRRTPS